MFSVVFYVLEITFDNYDARYSIVHAEALTFSLTFTSKVLH
jgi:hypothetical protein